MNHSIYSADRITHPKIVVVALIAGIAISSFAISAYVGSDNQTVTVVRAGEPMVISSADHLTLTR